MTDPAPQLLVPRKRKVDRKRWFLDMLEGQETTVLIAAVLFCLLAGLAPLLTYHPEVGQDTDSSIRPYGYIIALLLTAYGARNTFDSWTQYLVPYPIMITLLWCWASTLWAIDPDNSLKRIFLTTDVILTTFWLTRAMGGTSFLMLLRAAMVVLLVANFLAVLVAPDLGIHPPEDNKAYTIFGGMWRGLMAHKNFAGAACALTIVLFAFDCRDWPAKYRLLIVFFSAIFLYASQSKTSMGMTLVALLSGYVLEKSSGRMRVFLIFGVLIATVLFYILTAIYADALKVELLGPTAFTGRGQIWRMLLNYSSDHPLLGAGFESFWNIGPESPVYQYGLGFTTKVTVGHNGYLDLLVTIGYVGLALAIFSMMLVPLGQVLLSSKSVTRRSSLVGALLTFCIGHNFTESSLYERDALVGVFLVVAAALASDFPLGLTSYAKSGREKDAQDVMRAVSRRRRRDTPV